MPTELSPATLHDHQCIDEIDRWQQNNDEAVMKQQFIIDDFKSFTETCNWQKKRYCEWRTLGCLKWRISYYVNCGWLYLHMEFDQCRLHSEWMVDIIWNIEIVALNNVNETYHKGPHVTHFNNQELSKWLTRFYPYRYKEGGFMVEDCISVTVELDFQHMQIDHGLQELVERIIQLEKLMSEMKKEQEIQAVKNKERRFKIKQRHEDLAVQIEQLRTDFDARLAQKESRIAGTEENAVRLQVTNLVEEMRDGLEEQAAEAFERFERLQRQLENVSSFLQDLTASQNKPTVRSRQRGSLSSIDECSFSDRAKSPDSAVVETLNNNAQHKRFSTPFIRL